MSTWVIAWITIAVVVGAGLGWGLKLWMDRG